MFISKNGGIIESKLCYYCNLDNETLVHLFIECPIIRQIWVEFKDYILGRYGFHCMIDVESIIFNRVIDKFHVANFMCLIVKQYIYRQRCLRESIHFNALKLYINRIEGIEKYIAVKNDKVKKHNQKWN